MDHLYDWTRSYSTDPLNNPPPVGADNLRCWVDGHELSLEAKKRITKVRTGEYGYVERQEGRELFDDGLINRRTNKQYGHVRVEFREN